MVRWKTVMKAVLHQQLLQVRHWKGEVREGSRRQRALDAQRSRFAFLVCLGNHALRVSAPLGKQHHTGGMRAHQMNSPMRRWHAGHYGSI